MVLHYLDRHLLGKRGANDHTVGFAGVQIVIDQDYPIVVERIAQQVKHSSSRRAVVVISQLESECIVRPGVELDHNLHVDKVGGRSEAGADVVHSQERKLSR